MVKILGDLNVLHKKIDRVEESDFHNIIDKTLLTELGKPDDMTTTIVSLWKRMTNFHETRERDTVV